MRDTILKLLIEHGLKPDKASNATDALLRVLVDNLPSFNESEENASKHFIIDKDAADLTEAYEGLCNDAQHEWEGLMWGWEDAVRKILKILS